MFASLVRKSRNGRHRSAGRTAGQSLVEFALILPVLVVLTLGVVDAARVFSGWIAISNGVREAALWASQPPNYADAATVQAYVQNEGGLDGSKLTVSGPTCPGGCADTSASVTVSASYQIDLLVPVVASLFPVNVQASATAPMIDHRGPPP